MPPEPPVPQVPTPEPVASGEAPLPPIPAALAQAALAQLAEGVIVTDAAGRIIFVNAAAARLHGVARLDVPPESYAGAYHLFTEDGQPYPSTELPLARAALRGETVEEARWRIRRPDGSEILAVGSARPVRGVAGRQMGAVLTLRDDGVREVVRVAVRERDALAGQLREAFEQSPVSTVVYDATGRVVAANPAFERLWGARLADVPPGYSALTDPQLEAAGVLPLLRRAFGLDGAGTGDGAGEAIALPALRYDVASTAGRGRTLWAQAYAYPVRDATGAVERVVLSHEDVTARLETEGALREALAALEARNAQLQRQALALAAMNQRLLDSAAELKAQHDALQRTTEELTERSSAAEASGRRVRAVLESISDAFYALDRDWSFTYVNARAAEILGRSPDELLGHSIWVEFAPALGTAFEREYRRAMDTGRVVTFEAWYEPLAGWFELRAYPGPDGLSVYFRDITERRAAEAALRETEERLRLAVDSTGLGTWDYVPATDALHWDPRTKLAFGLRGDAEVRDYSAFFARVHPEDRARTQALVDAATDPAGSGEYDTTFRVVLPQAVERWVRARGRALFAGEGAGRYVTRFIGTVLDVTAERAASAERERLLAALAAEQARLTQVFEQAPVAVAVLRGRAVDDLVFELVNPRYEEMIPADRAPLGRRVRDALPEVVDTMGAVLQQVLDAGEPFVAHDYCVPLDRDGDGAPEAYYFNFVYHPLTDADSTVVGIVGVGTEVTDSVRARRDAERLWTAAEGARAEAERARADAEAANRAKGEFLAIMSHELRTPLNAIDGYAELMELGIRGPLTEQQRADLGRIRTSQRHLLGLINGVLNYSRIEAGAVRYAVEAVPVAETLSTCEALTAPQARARELTLGCRGCDATLCARGDREKVQQIVLNLLSNSVKFTERGGRVELACEARGDDVAITVTDTGRGIPADRLEQVFEPFVQVDASRTRTQEGVGLGLAISRDLARGMGGDLVAESTPGEGSTFTLTLARA